MNKKFLLICLILLLMLSGCANKEVSIKTKQIFAMDTIIELNIYTEDENVLKQIEQRILEIDRLMSRTVPGSEVSKINSLAGEKPVKVSEETFTVLKVAEKYQRLSRGAFQITILPLVELWDIGSDKLQIPSDAEINQAKEYCRPDFLELNDIAKTAYLNSGQSGIDLGAIAKGYVADEAVGILRENGIEHALISVGGGIQALGGKLDHKPWVLGLENPIEANRGYFATCEISNGSIVTSGDYQRFKVVENKKYHHIIDSQTGYPAENGLASVTVWSAASIDADALSTALYVMGIEDGLKLVDSIENTEAIFVTHSKDVIISQGLVDKLTLIDEEFSVNEGR